MLQHQKDFRIVAETDDGQKAIDLVLEMQPDVALLDVNLRQVSGITATTEICKRWEQARVIILLANGEKRPNVEAVRAGAVGVLRKDCQQDELVKAIYMVVSGDVYMSQGLVELAKAPIELLDNQQRNIQLTARQIEVLRLLAEGRSCKEIANEFNISSKTVDTHRLELMDKLQINNLAQLTKYAIRQGLISL